MKSIADLIEDLIVAEIALFSMGPGDEREQAVKEAKQVLTMNLSAWVQFPHRTLK